MPMKIKEVTRVLKIPSAYYAGGVYQTMEDLEIIENERTYEVNFLDTDDTKGGV